MNLKACIAILLFIAITVAAISADIPVFIDAASAIIVVGGAICFGICSSGKWHSNERLESASEGAVISGWLGTLYGAVIIAGNLTDMSALGPASAVGLLTVIYGYFVKASIRMILISRTKE